jgi:hypothetical protein
MKTKKIIIKIILWLQFLISLLFIFIFLLNAHLTVNNLAFSVAWEDEIEKISQKEKSISLEHKIGSWTLLDYAKRARYICHRSTSISALGFLYALFLVISSLVMYFIFDSIKTQALEAGDDKPDS